MSDQMNGIQTTWLEDGRRISKEMHRIYPRHIHGIAWDHTENKIKSVPTTLPSAKLLVFVVHSHQIRGARRFPLHRPGRRRVFVQAENHSPS